MGGTAPLSCSHEIPRWLFRRIPRNRSSNEGAWPALRASAHQFGEVARPKNIYLALRGLYTVVVRTKQHWESGIKLARR
ncbi:PLP-dependent transferase [Bradyrhizobium sp. NBAIM01]|nr:PLP-dependent transferase [Bradyrhizobium sp. NBAIM01]